MNKHTTLYYSSIISSSKFHGVIAKVNYSNVLFDNGNIRHWGGWYVMGFAEGAGYCYMHFKKISDAKKFVRGNKLRRIDYEDYEEGRLSNNKWRLKYLKSKQ